MISIVANLIAFLSFIEFANSLVSWLAGLVGAEHINFQYIVGQIFVPVAFLMGVRVDECQLVGQLVAIKTIVNEFAAYSQLSQYIRQGIISVSLIG